jgi:hypothetical protein
MVNRFAILVLGFALSATALAEGGHVHFVGDFESGLIKSSSSTHDGFYIATLTDPQRSDEFLHSGQSDFGPDANADTRVVSSEIIGGQTVRARAGQFFIRSQISYEKDYLLLNNEIKNRPRSKIYMSNPIHAIDYDKEGYVGFSIFTAKNFESELGVRDRRGEAMVFVMSSDSSRTLITLSQFVQSPATEAHWFICTWTSADSVEEGGSKFQQYDLGPVSADAGKWTDFVIRYRFNPFSVATNPAAKGISGAKDQTYQGNKGILQVWKAQGPVDGDGNRQMAMEIDKVNTPVGLVPHATDKIKHHWRIYKYGWHSNPTTLTHPVWFGFDEIRQGLVERDGTTYADVAPASAACKMDCDSAPVDSKPKPPTSVAVN